MPEDFDPSALFGDGQGGGPGGGFGGMGSGDVKLQYTDDDPDSYPNIFDSAKTDITQADRTRLIQALKALGEGDVDSALDMDQVLRYLVVHNFVVNGDSYTGSMVHNYYLYEEDGRLSMLPWDYNLAFGTFQSNDAGQAVNDPIDTPLSVTGSGDRPMADWILADEEYTAQYHQYFEEFLSAVDPAVIIGEVRELIDPYVERDPTRFCGYEEFEAGAEARGAGELQAVPSAVDLASPPLARTGRPRDRPEHCGGLWGVRPSAAPRPLGTGLVFPDGASGRRAGPGQGRNDCAVDKPVGI